MAYNARITEQIAKLSQAACKFGELSPEYSREEETYWKIFEEEVEKDGEDAIGWAAYENPEDTLTEALLEKCDKAFVAKVLESYQRFFSVWSRLVPDSLLEIDDELVEWALQYVA